MNRIPAVSDIDIAFGGADQHLPPFDHLPPDFRKQTHPLCDAVERIFYSGGRIEEYGIRWRNGVDSFAATRLMKALLASFGPRHEHKIAGVAFLLSGWTEPIPGRSE